MFNSKTLRLLALLVPMTAWAALDWDQAAGPRGTQIRWHRGSTLQPGLRVAWSAPNTGTISDEPVSFQGRVYRPSGPSLEARDQATGKVLWVLGDSGKSIAGPVCCSRATDGTTLLYALFETAAGDVEVQCLSDQGAGTSLLWARGFPAASVGPLGQLTLGSDLLYIALAPPGSSSPNRIEGLHASDGSPAFSYGLEGVYFMTEPRVTCDPVTGDCFFTVMDRQSTTKELRCVTATGVRRWRVPIGDYLYHGVVVDPRTRRLYLEDDVWPFKGRLRCFNAATGAILWQHETGVHATFTAPLVLSGGLVFAGGASKDESGHWIVSAFDAATGGLVWQRRAPMTDPTRYGEGPVMTATGDSLLWFLDGQGGIRCVDRATGSPLGEFTLPARPELWGCQCFADRDSLYAISGFDLVRLTH